MNDVHIILHPFDEVVDLLAALRDLTIVAEPAFLLVFDADVDAVFFRLRWPDMPVVGARSFLLPSAELAEWAGAHTSSASGADVTTVAFRSAASECRFLSAIGGQ